MSGLYTQIISNNPSKEKVLDAIGLDLYDIDRFRDVDVPPYNRYRQLPLFTDSRFKTEDDCKDKKTIVVLTRTGGANRADYKENWDKLRNHPNYVTDYDCDFDDTYAYIEFSVDPTILEGLKTLNMNPDYDLKKLIDSNLSIMQNLSFALGGNKMSDSEMYEKAKKVAFDMIKGI